MTSLASLSNLRRVLTVKLPHHHVVPPATKPLHPAASFLCAKNFGSCSSPPFLSSSSNSRAVACRRWHPPPRLSNSRTLAAAAASSEPVHVCVKASEVDSDVLGECPFCQRVLLTLEEKKLPYDTKLIKTSNKPEWFLKVNPEGKVPVADFGDGKWISDSDVITALIEEKFPEPSLATPPEFASVGSNILFSFMKFVKSKDPNDGSEEALLDDLTAFNEHLKEHGPYVNGDRVSSVDLSLAPKLYHLEAILGHFKNWNIPENFTHLREYMKLLFDRDSFKKTKGVKEYLIAAWEPKLSS